MKRQHPLSSFLFCPRCGEAGLEHVHERAIHCTHCDLTYFHNVASSVACFVLDKDGQILTVRRGREPLEETGLRVQCMRYAFSIPNIYPYSGIDVYTADTFWVVRVESFEGAVAQDDAEELVICSPEELRAEDFGLVSIRASIERLLADRSVLDD